MNFWYAKTKIARLVSWLLLPLSVLFWLISSWRRFLWQKGWLASYRAPVPVIIVGNLSVGGNGKTPVVVWLVDQLQQRGVNVGVISRGYGSQAKQYPLLVSAQTDPQEGGDEPVLIAKRTGAPVCISPNRRQAIELLLRSFPCDLIISDDGLQHYPLQRDMEIVVVDGERVFGNGFVLPAGPLRELPARLKQVDLIIANEKSIPHTDTLMRLVPYYAINLKTQEKRLLTEFVQQPAIALAGIGHPPRFFSMLQTLGIQLLHCHAFADHQAYSVSLIQPLAQANTPLLMTEKDAVKCENFAQENWWFVPIEAQIDARSAMQFIDKIIKKVNEDRR
uniref:Tetraacyldisaccharide 4'-kinase n=1 Tax=Actinobacillus seminis TaxID=722 RepID=A0A263HE17_9PAST|nr:tetraacyldisaccharide 4'-kinase [Actinobacillus seminis]OZN25371.1 tetraacyldisaccharide 4'-kinase [Actinobacillus seminis]SUU35611.1 tetraacyldisaccharide 4'-kinase [Actinobacillus seminis]